VKVGRRKGRLTLRLEPVEVELLESLFDQLEALLDGPDGDGAEAIRRRLVPDGYRDDPGAAAEFRRLTADTLRAERDERIGACRAELARTQPAQGGEVDLTDPDTARRWIQVLNDLRLAFGTRLGVTEQDSPYVDPDDPDADLRSVYHWLSAVQDSVVSELMG
jgi:hypothetical protein